MARGPPPLPWAPPARAALAAPGPGSRGPGPRSLRVEWTLRAPDAALRVDSRAVPVPVRRATSQSHGPRALTGRSARPLGPLRCRQCWSRGNLPGDQRETPSSLVGPRRAAVTVPWGTKGDAVPPFSSAPWVDCGPSANGIQLYSQTWLNRCRRMNLQCRHPLCRVPARAPTGLSQNQPHGRMICCMQQVLRPVHPLNTC